MSRSGRRISAGPEFDLGGLSKFKLDAQGACWHEVNPAMYKFPLLLGGAALLFVALPQTQAADSDPGYTYRRSDGSVSSPGTFYRPTLRYYGKDYTVAYGFVPWDKRAARVKPVVTEDHFTLSESQVARFRNRSPRVIYTQRKPAITKVAAPRPAITTAPANQTGSATAPAAEAPKAQ